MKHKKRIGCTMALLYCIACSIVMSFSRGGFFSVIGAIGTLHGGGRNAPPEWVPFAMDIVTAPIQLSIMWSLSLLERIFANTSKSGRQKAERERRHALYLQYLALLDEDFERAYTLPDFQCPTNQIAMEALDKWIWCRQQDVNWCSNSLPQYAEHVISHPEIMPSLKSLWRLSKKEPGLQHKGLLKAVQLAEENSGEDVKWLIWAIMGAGSGDGQYLIPDEVINQYTNSPNPLVSWCAQDALTNRASHRESIRRHEEYLLRLRKRNKNPHDLHQSVQSLPLGDMP